MTDHTNRFRAARRALVGVRVPAAGLEDGDPGSIRRRQEFGRRLRHLAEPRPGIHRQIANQLEDRQWMQADQIRQVGGRDHRLDAG